MMMVHGQFGKHYVVLSGTNVCTQRVFGESSMPMQIDVVELS